MKRIAQAIADWWNDVIVFWGGGVPERWINRK
jgi:hypothetical protein